MPSAEHLSSNLPSSNPRLDLLKPYPFERLRALIAQPWQGPAPIAAYAKRVDLSIGEPRHASPPFVLDALSRSLDGLSRYPATAGTPELRTAIAEWIGRRHRVQIDAQTQVLPVLGSREALFAFAQTVIDPTADVRPVVVSPNPFYQIYEGAALLAGARVHLVPQLAERDFHCDWASVPESVWRDTRLLYVCSPGNPTGAVIDIEEWRALFDLADRHGFVIASDECYSEIYLDESRPPIGGLGAAQSLGREDFRNLVVFSSLSKRSNVPGMRSGFVAGDARLLAAFLKYRTYHGSAMALPIQQASIAAWGDEQHVADNRAKYRDKFDRALVLLAPTGLVTRPEAGFYLWMAVPPGDDGARDDEAFTRLLHHQYNVAVLPGSFLGRDSGAGNPGKGRIRIALVAEGDDCLEGIRRIRSAVDASTQNERNTENE